MNSRFQKEKRQPPYYLLTGLLLGLALGFILTMVILPVQYSNVPPETLNPTDKDRYRVMVSLAYQANQDIGRAKARLGLLRDDDIAGQLIQQSRRSQTRSDAQILMLMAQAIQNPFAQSPLNISSPEPPLGSNENEEFIPSEFETPEPTSENLLETTSTPNAEKTQAKPTPQPMISPTPTQVTDLPFELTKNEKICNSSYKESLIQVEVFNAKGEPFPDIKVTVNWEDGQDSFFTGFYPDISLGYADFTMQPPTIYSVRVGKNGELISNLISSECKDDNGNKFWGSIYLRFDAP